MTPDDWILFGKIVGAAVAGGWITWKLHSTEKKAGKAEIYAKPTGNGFANEVKQSLARIEASQQRSDQILFNHIMAHADADVLKGVRSESPSDPNSP